MALSVAPLAGFPANNSALLNPANGSPVDAAAFSYSANPSVFVEDANNTFTYTPGSTTYVAGVLDKSGVQPSRIFTANNTGANQAAIPLPTLISVTLIDQASASIQEFSSTTAIVSEPGNFIVLLLPAAGSLEDGVFPLGYPGPVGWTAQGGAYSNANAVTGYPQPVMEFKLSFNAMLILASTQYG